MSARGHRPGQRPGQDRRSGRVHGMRGVRSELSDRSAHSSFRCGVRRGNNQYSSGPKECFVLRSRTREDGGSGMRRPGSSILMLLVRRFRKTTHDDIFIQCGSLCGLFEGQNTRSGSKTHIWELSSLYQEAHISKKRVLQPLLTIPRIRADDSGRGFNCWWGHARDLYD